MGNQLYIYDCIEMVHVLYLYVNIAITLHACLHLPFNSNITFPHTFTLRELLYKIMCPYKRRSSILGGASGLVY